MDFLGAILKKMGMPWVVIVLVVCAIVVTLCVAGIVNQPLLEGDADAIIRQETGIDLQKVEEGIKTRK